MVAIGSGQREDRTKAEAVRWLPSPRTTISKGGFDAGEGLQEYIEALAADDLAGPGNGREYFDTGGVEAVDFEFFAHVVRDDQMAVELTGEVAFAFFGGVADEPESQ